MIKSLVFNEQQINFILANYKGLYNQELTDLVNKEFNTKFTYNQIKGLKHRNKLDSGITGYFKKGQVAYNKGLKQEEFMSKEAIERTRKTRFIKGQRSHNEVPIGHERTTPDGYVEIKVRDAGLNQSTKNFELKHRYIWEQHYGEELDAQDVILFLDQDRKNFDINNLVKVSKADVARINQKRLFTNDIEINNAAISWAKLIQAMHTNKEE